jgi:GGDEF domain-containing protein/HD-like signal output (HDOD) protein
MRLIQLGKIPDAELDDYVKVISADAAMCAKLLGLANSPWYGVSNKVTTVKTAVNLLGLTTVRKAAISYCVVGLHNSLGLSSENSRMFWRPSLFKAVAAKHFVSLTAPDHVDEAFSVGLLQDFVLPIFYAVSADQTLGILQDPGLDWRSQLARERQVFQTDHVQAGHKLAKRLDLPRFFDAAISCHHDYEALAQAIETPAVRDAVFCAALLPHLLGVSNEENLQELQRFLIQNSKLSKEACAELMQAIETEFVELSQYFEGSESPEAYGEVMGEAAQELADYTQQLIATVNELMEQSSRTGMHFNKVITEFEETSAKDQLTDVFNRSGFVEQARDRLQQAARERVSMAIGYLDIDYFKRVNDRHGHAVGDAVLQAAAQYMQRAVRQFDLVGRIGGDEFVLLLYNCAPDQAQAVVDRIVADPLLEKADQLMYAAKNAGGNRSHCRAITENDSASG